jgi:hypothetical protein
VRVFWKVYVFLRSLLYLTRSISVCSSAHNRLVLCFHTYYCLSNYGGNHPNKFSPLSNDFSSNGIPLKPIPHSSFRQRSSRDSTLTDVTSMAQPASSISHRQNWPPSSFSFANMMHHAILSETVNFIVLPLPKRSKESSSHHLFLSAFIVSSRNASATRSTPTISSARISLIESPAPRQAVIARYSHTYYYISSSSTTPWNESSPETSSSSL